MRTSERKLYEFESDIRPNRYVALALTVLSVFLIVMLLMNEIGLFLVVKARMRFCVFSALIILDIPLFMAGTDKGLKNDRTKFLMIGCVGIVAFLICTLLSFHATLIILLPMLLAAQYPSLKASRIAIGCSLLCALVSPVLGYLTGLWDSAFIERLAQFLGWAVRGAVGDERMGQAEVVFQILLYLSIPHMLITMAFYPLTRSIAQGGEERLKNQIRVLHMSESDALTGLLNRMSFERELDREPDPQSGNVAVVYADANGLHRINNEQGHSAGDRLLVCVADSLRNAFGGENVYRTGGDEFITVLYGLTLSDVQERTAGVRAQVEERGYSVSCGIEYAQPPCTLRPLVDAAETKMMADKALHHITR